MRENSGPHHDQFFYPSNPLGRNTVLKVFKAGAVILGLSNPDKFSPHSLCSYFVTRLANDSGASAKECMAASRHSSVAASATYQERSAASKFNKFYALGIQLPTLGKK